MHFAKYLSQLFFERPRHSRQEERKLPRRKVRLPLLHKSIEHPRSCGQRRLVDEPYETPFLVHRKFIPAGKQSFGDSLGGAIILNLSVRT